MSHHAVGVPPAVTIGGVLLETRRALPMFSSPPIPSTGLDLLAAAAQAAIPPPASTPQTRPPAQLHHPGPYNPGASLSTTALNKILSLKFVEMAEVSAEDPPPGNTTRPTPPKIPITDISQWLEKYSVMAAVLAQRFPEKAPELFAYQAYIIRCERNYQRQQWVAYDRRFRKEALAVRSLDWSVPNQRLFQEAFTGRAKEIPRCSYCLEDDHAAAACPSNPHRPLFTWPTNMPQWPGPSHQQPAPWTPTDPTREVCRRFNFGSCRMPQSRCKYLHACSGCRGNHRASACPLKTASNTRPTWPPSQGNSQAPTNFPSQGARPPFPH